MAILKPEENANYRQECLGFVDKHALSTFTVEWRWNEGTSSSAVFQCHALHVFYKSNIPVNKYWWLTNERPEYQPAISVIRLCRNVLYFSCSYGQLTHSIQKDESSWKPIVCLGFPLRPFAPVQWCFLSAMAVTPPVKRFLFISLFALTTKESSKTRICIFIELKYFEYWILYWEMFPMPSRQHGLGIFFQ